MGWGLMRAMRRPDLTDDHLASGPGAPDSGPRRTQRPTRVRSFVDRDCGRRELQSLLAGVTAVRCGLGLGVQQARSPVDVRVW